MTTWRFAALPVIALLGLNGCVVAPPPSQPYYPPYAAQPVPPPALMGEGLVFADEQPTMVLGGETVFFLFTPQGWGYWDGYHRWHRAPESVRGRLESRYPRGQGLRPSRQATIGALPAATRPGGSGGWRAEPGREGGPPGAARPVQGYAGPPPGSAHPGPGGWQPGAGYQRPAPSQPPAASYPARPQGGWASPAAASRPAVPPAAMPRSGPAAAPQAQAPAGGARDQGHRPDHDRSSRCGDRPNC